MYNERQVYSVDEESSDDAEESDSDEESGSASSSSSSESEDEFEKFVNSNKKQPPRKSPPAMVPELTSGKLACQLCPTWFNEYAQEKEIFIRKRDLEIHHMIWHNPRYMPDKCSICCFRAENLTELKHQHDNHPELCRILTQNKTYIRLEEHLDGGGSGRRGRKSRNASGKSDVSPLHIPTQVTIPKPSSISPKLPKPTIPKTKDEKKSKQSKGTSEFNIPTLDLTSSPSPDRSSCKRPSPHHPSPSLPPGSPSSVVSSIKSNNSSKSSLNTSLPNNSKSPTPKENKSPEGKDDKHSPKPEDHKKWTYEEVTHVNDIAEGEAKFTCDECNINELIWDKFKQAQLESHKKLWHSNYTYTECPKCQQRFETITDMNNSKDHKQHCVVWQAGNVLSGLVISSKRRKRPSTQPITHLGKTKPKNESRTVSNKPKVQHKGPTKQSDAAKVPEKVPTKTPQKLIEKVRKMIPDRKIGPDSSQKPKIPAKPKKSVNTSTPMEMLQTDDDADDLPLDELPILVPFSSPIEKVPTMVYECPLCLKDHPPAQDLFSNCDTSDMIEIPELETFMPKF